MIDIKPANILINSMGEVKLADFGLGKELYGSMPKSYVGTIAYLSPENLERRLGQDTIITHKSDVWSLGLSLLECALGRFPFETDGLFENHSTTLHDLIFPSTTISKELLDFLSLCLTRNQSLRNSAKSLTVSFFDL
jgi:serine/threonine protein kinase